MSNRILSGLQIEGSKLISVRKLAKEHAISPVTVMKAYELLEQDGLIYRIHGKGSFVRFRTKTKEQDTTTQTNPYSWQESHKDYLNRVQFSNPIRIPSFENGYDLSNASINPNLLPTEKIISTFSETLRRDIPILSEYGQPEGDPEFRQALSNYFKRIGLKTNYDQIIVTNGGQQGLHLVASTFIGKNDVVFVEAPTYPGAIDIFTSRGARIIPIPMDENGLKVDELYALCDKYKPKLIYTIPCFNNPTGYCLSKQRKKILLDLAESYDFIIVEDDAWGELNYDDCHRIALKSLDRTGRVIFIKGFSKVIGPTYRLGAIVAEGSFLHRLALNKSNSDLGSPLLIQRLLMPFFSSNNIDTYIDELRKKLKAKLMLVDRILQQHAPPQLRWTLPKGGLNIWLKMPRGYSSDRLFIDYLQEEKISILPGSMFFTDNNMSNCFRITFSYLDDVDLQFAVKRLCECVTAFVDRSNN